MKIDRRDGPWLLASTASLAVGLAVSWQRWGNPLVDCGREMSQPLRLLQGQRLYADVSHIYGPLAPYLNALLYRLFGVHLAVLDAHGIAATVAILWLTYWISRQIMGRAAATGATLGVTWLCALKQSGNYVMPYAYAAVDGCALGLGALALSMRFVQSGQMAALAGAGALAGLACLAKAEMGVAAAAVVVAAVLVRSAGHAGRGRALVVGLAPVLLLMALGYGSLAVQVGWRTLAYENYLLPLRLPPALVFYNRRMFGFDEPLRSLAQMLAISLRLALVSVLTLCLALCCVRRAATVERRAARARTLRRAFWITAALLISVAATWQVTEWDKGPFLAVPFLLVATLLFSRRRARDRGQRTGRIAGRAAQLMIVSAFALATLARTLLRVRSGGAYSSYLLPAAIIVFVYSWTCLLPLVMPDSATRRAARRATLLLVFGWMAATAAITMSRYGKHFTYALATPRGTMLVRPDLGIAFDQAMAFIGLHSRRGDALAVLPEGTALDFFTDRRNPLNEEITTPGLLDEPRAIRRLAETRAPLVLITNRLTEEFGAPAIGRDYYQNLMRVLEQDYDACGLFGENVTPGMAVGDPRFFIRAYCRKNSRGHLGDPLPDQGVPD
jgi:hypothetical protein